MRVEPSSCRKEMLLGDDQTPHWDGRAQGRVLWVMTPCWVGSGLAKTEPLRTIRAD